MASILAANSVGHHVAEFPFLVVAAIGQQKREFSEYNADGRASRMALIGLVINTPLFQSAGRQQTDALLPGKHRISDGLAVCGHSGNDNVPRGMEFSI